MAESKRFGPNHDLVSEVMTIPDSWIRPTGGGHEQVSVRGRLKEAELSMPIDPATSPKPVTFYGFFELRRSEYIGAMRSGSKAPRRASKVMTFARWTSFW
jgi:hypothetical protein